MVSLGDFPDTERFRCIRRIGKGSFGTVYEVFDQERGTNVAAKVLREEPIGNAVLRFKNEFRGLTELRHPNIVKLYELLSESGQWFFTMELLEDAHTFREWVRPLDAPWIDPASDPTTPVPPPDRTQLTLVDEFPVTIPVRRPASTLQLDRLRDALKQLAAGVHAIHQARKLHRDIKPNNVLVTGDGRVVLVDFGLMTPQDEEHNYGTPAYMAPEQVSDSSTGPEADWYAVGVMLYEALTGEVPFRAFEDSLDTVLRRKLTTDPPPPQQLAPDVPADLAELCVGLVRRDPGERIPGLEVLRRLGVQVGHEHKRADARRARTSIFVGRQQELAKLRASYDEVRQGRASLVLVQGESGVGKSELLRRFVQPLGNQGAVVLVGRCYERESVPYKAWDGVVDHLSEHLAQLNDRGSTLVPRHTPLLLSAFPVLRRVEGLVRAPVGNHHNLQPHERRARVFDAFRELLGRMADQHPVVIVIDDLQWADQDSIDLLSAVMQPPGAPSILLLASVREITETAMRDRVAQIPGAGWLRLHPLDTENAEELVRQLAAAESSGVCDVSSIAFEADGHPMFIEELVRHARQGGKFASPLRLEDALSERIHRLPSSARRLLEMLAVAGRPVSRELSARAAQMDVGAFVSEIDALQLGNLVRTDGTRRTDMIEPYHDRVREAVLAKIDDQDRRTLHERLAIAMETSGQADAEALAIHWHGAGDALKAASFAVTAAAQAFEALAFDRAARLYRRAIELWPDNPNAISVWSQLGESLVNAGRGAAAAEVLTEAARLAEPAVAIGLRQRAAEQLLRSGHIDAGIELLAPLLAEHGLAMPSSRGAAIQALLRTRVSLWFGRRTERRIEPARPNVDLTAKKQMELCWSTMLGIFTVDQLMGMVYHSRHLQLARRAADPVALARGLAMEAIYLTANGESRAEVDAALERAAELAARVRQPYCDAFLHLARGTVAFLSGSWREALDECRLADRGFRDGCPGATWETDSAQQIIRWALCYTGALPQLVEHVTAGLRDAGERNDLYASMSARSGFPNMAWLVGDDPERGSHETNEAIAQWSQKGFHLQHLFDLIAKTHIDLYLDDGMSAYSRLASWWKEIEASGLMRVQCNRVMVRDLRARAALARAKKAPAEAAPLRREVTGIARQLRREARPWAEALAVLLEAQTLPSAQAAVRFSEAQAKLEAVGMKPFAIAAQAAQSAELRRKAEDELGEMGAVAPERLLRVFTPAF